VLEIYVINKRRNTIYMSTSPAGKGDYPRPVDIKKYSTNHDEIKGLGDKFKTGLPKGGRTRIVYGPDGKPKQESTLFQPEVLEEGDRCW
jgi:hypothetical protein